MPTRRFVEPLDVIEHIGPRFLARGIDLASLALHLRPWRRCRGRNACSRINRAIFSNATLRQMRRAPYVQASSRPCWETPTESLSSARHSCHPSSQWSALSYAWSVSQSSEPRQDLVVAIDPRNACTGVPSISRSKARKIRTKIKAVWPSRLCGSMLGCQPQTSNSASEFLHAT